MTPLIKIILLTITLFTFSIFILKQISPWFRAKWYFGTRTMQVFIYYAFRRYFSPVKLPMTDEHMSKEWLRKVIEEKLQMDVPEISNFEIIRESLQPGLNGELTKIIIKWCDEITDSRIPRSVIVKTSRPSMLNFIVSAFTGSLREALFYQFMDSDDTLGVMPTIYYSQAVTETGEYVIVMEDLSGTTVPGGHLFGNQCWGKVELPSDVEQNPVKILEVLFKHAAQMHAKYWRDKKLLKHSWLRNVDYLNGSDKDKWEFSMYQIQEKWENLMSIVKNNQTTVKWSDKLINEMNFALRRTNWKAYQKTFNIKKPKTAFTLCHGDFHAGNVLWSNDQQHCKTPFYLVDWAEVGVQCPFTDLAQFVIGNVSIDVRRKHEEELFNIYHKQLIESGVDAETFPLEVCWYRYKSGGIERWLQMLTILASIDGLQDSAIQWFHDQVSAFIEDHGTCTTPLFTAFCIPV
jgi:thiamine kinase-like enzyme